MAITVRAVVVALLGVLVVGVAGAWGFLVSEGVLATGVLIDLALAGGVRSLQFTRSGLNSVRQGEPAVVRLLVTNRGQRRVRGRLRDGWPPSAGATPHDVAIDVPAGERRWVETTLRPSRRGGRRG